jgi:hypothetical protein
LQHGRHLLIVGGDAGADIGHQNDGVGAVDGQLGLAAHLAEDHTSSEKGSMPPVRSA